VPSCSQPPALDPFHSPPTRPSPSAMPSTGLCRASATSRPPPFPPFPLPPQDVWPPPGPAIRAGPGCPALPCPPSPSFPPLLSPDLRAKPSRLLPRHWCPPPFRPLMLPWYAPGPWVHPGLALQGPRIATRGPEICLVGPRARFVPQTLEPQSPGITSGKPRHKTVFCETREGVFETPSLWFHKTLFCETMKSATNGFSPFLWRPQVSSNRGFPEIPSRVLPL